MRVRTILLLAIAADCIAIAGGCSKDRGSSPPTPEAIALTADLRGARSVALTLPAVATAQSFALESTSGGATFSTLVKVDSAGNVTEVLDQSRPAYDVAITPTHVLVSGNFHNILAVNATGGSMEITCYLAAISRTAAGDSVECLAFTGLGGSPGSPLPADQLSVFHNRAGDSGFEYVDEPGFVAWGTTAFFAVVTGNGPASELRRWLAGSGQTETLIHFSSGAPMLYQPYVAPDGSHLCVVSIGANSEGGQTICGPIGGSESSWADASAVIAQFTAFQVGSTLYTGQSHQASKLIDLSDLSQQIPATPVDLPRLRDDSLPLLDGQRTAFLRDGAIGMLYATYSTANNPVVDSSVTWSRMLGDGNFGWFYGSSQLRRLDRNTGVLEATNYLGQTGMLTVTGMSFSTANRIRLDGTAANGDPVIVAIDTSSGEVTVTTEDLPQFQQTAPLQ